MSYARFNLHGVLGLATAFFNLTLGGVVLAGNSKSPLNRSFFRITVFLSIYLLTFAMLSIVERESDAVFWLSLAYFGIPFISPEMYAFSAKWVKRPHKKVAAVGYGLAIVACFIVFFLTDKVATVATSDWGRHGRFLNTTNARVFYCAVLATFYCYAGLAVRNIYLGWRASRNKKERNLFAVVLIGFIAGYTGSVDFYTAITGKGYPFGYISITLLMLSFAFGVIRFRFFDIDLMFKRLSAVSVVYVFLLGVSIPLVFYFVRQSFPKNHEAFRVTLAVGAAFGGVLSLGPFLYGYLLNSSFWLRHERTTGLAHELKSPLAAISGAARVLNDSLEDLPDPHKSRWQTYLEIINRNAERLGGFAQQLLVASKISEGEFDLQRVTFDLKNLASEILDSFSGLITQKKLAAELKAPKESAIVFADEEKMRQVITNLISNSIKFSTSGGSLVLEIQRQDDELLVSVADTGRGIRESDLPHVFDRFFQGESTASGSGLGLAIARGWVEAHGGRIWATSSGLNKGAEFFFTLPVDSTQDSDVTM